MGRSASHRHSGKNAHILLKAEIVQPAKTTLFSTTPKGSIDVHSD